MSSHTQLKEIHIDDIDLEGDTYIGHDLYLYLYGRLTDLKRLVLTEKSAEKSVSSKSRIEYIANIKAIAILMVVFLHSASPLFYQHNAISNSSWYITVLYDSFVRCAVPLFLIANGALILNRDYTMKNWILDKIIKRLILPLIFYAGLVMYVNHIPLSSLRNLSSVGYWFPFIGIILTCYLMYPVIRVWLKHTTKNLIYYFLLLWLISMVIRFISPSFDLYSTSFIYGYVGFPVFGYLMTKIDAHKYYRLGLPFYLLSVGLVFTFTLLTNLHGVSNESYFEYLSPFVISMSLGLYVYLKEVNIVIKNRFVRLIRDFLSDHSLGIYFLHPLILTRLYFLHSAIHPVFSDWLIFTLGIVVTSCLICFMSKIPLLRYVSG